MALVSASRCPQNLSLAPTQRQIVCFRYTPAAITSRPLPIHRNERLQSVRTLVQQRFSTQFIGGGSGANQIFVAGADSQLGARIIQKLLQAGFKVTAGVPDENAAQSVVSFATSVELLKKQEAQKLSLAEVDLADEASLLNALPKRGARVVVIVGEGGSGSKSSRLDARAATRLLLASQQVQATQFVLVATAGSGGGGGFFGGLFGGSGQAGGSGAKPSKLEQDIAQSGLDFAIVRTGRTDAQDPEFESTTNVAVGAQGSMPKQAKISKNQAAQAVQQVVRLADSDVLVEVWAGADEPAIDIEDAVLQALPDAAITGQDIESEEDDDDDSLIAEEPEAEAPKPRGGLFGGFGTQRIKAGTQRVKAGTPPAQPASKPAAGKRSAKTEEVDADSDASPKGALKGIFGSKKKDLSEADVGPDQARKSAAKGVKAAVRGRNNGVGTNRPGAEEAKPKKGFLASIGLGGETTYVDDED